MDPMQTLAKEYEKAKNDPEFQAELDYLLRQYCGRPTPLYYAERWTEKLGGAKIYLKREDLLHTGAHKINNALGQILLAKRLGKKRIIAETGAGQHGVATATVCARFGMECVVYMGQVDMERQALNVARMELLGAKVVPVTAGQATLKEAVNEALRDWVSSVDYTHYILGSALGSHPFPMMVRDFQSVVGNEAKVQFKEMTGGNPAHIVACVGGGSNAMGIFTAFLDDNDVELYGVEPAGRSLEIDGEHAATITKGEPGVMHGFNSYMLKDAEGEPQEVYSVASGLDYPAVGPQHAYLKDIGRVNYASAGDKESIDAFFELSRLEGIIPAVESAHAISFALKLAAEKPASSILVNLSGRGDKDIDFVVDEYGKDYGIS